MECGYLSATRMLIEEVSTQLSVHSLKLRVRSKKYSIMQLLVYNEVDREHCESNWRTALVKVVIKEAESSIPNSPAASASLDKIVCKRKNALSIALQGGMEYIASKLVETGALARMPVLDFIPAVFRLGMKNC